MLAISVREALRDAVAAFGAGGRRARLARRRRKRCSGRSSAPGRRRGPNGLPAELVEDPGGAAFAPVENPRVVGCGPRADCPRMGARIPALVLGFALSGQAFLSATTQSLEVMTMANLTVDQLVAQLRSETPFHRAVAAEPARHAPRVRPAGDRRPPGGLAGRQSARPPLRGRSALLHRRIEVPASAARARRGAAGGPALPARPSDDAGARQAWRGSRARPGPPDAIEATSFAPWRCRC